MSIDVGMRSGLPAIDKTWDHSSRAAVFVIGMSMSGKSKWEDKKEKKKRRKLMGESELRKR